MGKVDALELSLNKTLVFGAQQGQVVEAGPGRGWSRHRIRFDVGMNGIDQAIGLGQLQEGVLKPEFEVGEVEGVIAKFNRLAAPGARPDGGKPGGGWWGQPAG